MKVYRHAFNKSPRCQFRTPSGKRCRFNASNPDSETCENHTTLAENRREAADLSATLTAGLNQFKSAAELNDFLTRLLLLLAQDRISARRAAVLAYITNQLLRTVTAMEQEAAAAQAPKNRPVNIIWDIPRPSREQIDIDRHSAVPQTSGVLANGTKPT